MATCQELSDQRDAANALAAVYDAEANALQALSQAHQAMAEAYVHSSKPRLKTPMHSSN